MRLTDYCPLSARIVEVGASDGWIGQSLVSAGYRRYLCLARDVASRAAIVRQHAKLASQVAVAASSRVVGQNNADLLILHGWFLLQLARFRSLRHAEWVAWRLRPALPSLLAIGIALFQWLVGRVSWPRIVQCRSPERNRKRRRRAFLQPAKYSEAPCFWMVVCHVRRRRPHRGARRFIPHEVGVRGFFRRLQTQHVRYAVLRWFETLPGVAAGEDLDLLVDDAHLEIVEAVLEEGPGIQAVDVYSVTGLPGTDFQNMPYFPPRLAEELLDRAVVSRDLCRVPAPREHFLSLAYHALYHKGSASGLPPCPGSLSHVRCTDHNYADTLCQLAERSGINAPISLQELDHLLDTLGWRPPHDMLVRLSRRNDWVGSLLRGYANPSLANDRLTVFLLRELALTRGGVERATELLQKDGFQILATEPFDGQRATLIARSIRGGNWGRGPWPLCGGPPVAAIVAYDPDPITPSRSQRRRYPFLANARLLCKEQIREAFNLGLPGEQHCNVIHSSDNGHEAVDYLRIVMPLRVDEILDHVGCRRLGRAA